MEPTLNNGYPTYEIFKTSNMHYVIRASEKNGPVLNCILNVLLLDDSPAAGDSFYTSKLDIRVNWLFGFVRQSKKKYNVRACVHVFVALLRAAASISSFRYALIIRHDRFDV